MSVTYGLTIENEKLILERAKSKNNGVFSFRGVVYRVLDNKVTHLCAKGKILERAYGFNVVVGEYETGMGSDDRARKLLKGLTK